MLGGVSVDELRRRYRERRPSRGVLEALHADPRAGVRALARQIERRVRDHERERARVARLYRAQSALAARAGPGCERVAGVDEVGMGPLAGPVVAAAVVLPPRPRLLGLDDSKQLSARARARLESALRGIALDVGIGVVVREEIDRLNIFHAGLLAMRRAVEALSRTPDLVAVDGRDVPGLPMMQSKCPGGDARIACISAASILAKQYRDRWMEQLDVRYPGYGFARNAGYGTAEHLRALRRRGPTPEHRLSFAPVREWLASGPSESPCRTS